MKKTPKFERRVATLTGEGNDGLYHDNVSIEIVRTREDDEGETIAQVRLPDGGIIEVNGYDLSPTPHCPALNTEKLTHFCERSAHGAMGQVFLIEAICKYAEMVEAMPQDQRDSMENGMISYDLWSSVAAEAREFFTRRD